MTITAATFRCDRDGVEAASETDNAYPGEPPRDWLQLNASGKHQPTVAGHLCPACSAAFQEFMSNAAPLKGGKP